jgi:hypothetical protein
MNTREKFKRRVIELIHGKPYEEAIKKESFISGKTYMRQSPATKPFLYLDSKKDIGISGKNEGFLFDFNSGVISTTATYIYDCEVLGLQITIGRVIQAIKNKIKENIFNEKCPNEIRITISNSSHNIIIDAYVIGVLNCTVEWKLTKENGQECTDDDQADETIEALYSLIKEV